MNYALLYNPIAGRGAAANIARRVVDQLETAGSTVLEGRSERAGHIEQMSREYGTRVDRVLVLGGDGSLREAAKGLLALGPPGRASLGVLPMGSGNVVARELGLPLDPVRAAAELGDMGVRPFDVGFAAADGCEAEPFLAMAGVGFDAGIAAGIARARAKRFGAGWYRFHADSMYGCLATRELLRLRAPRFSVELDGRRIEERAVAAVVANVETYAKGMAMAPGARCDDGVLDLHVRSSVAPWVTLMAHLQAQRRRPSPGWAARSDAGRSLRLRTPPAGAPFAWQLDGDAMGSARSLEIHVEAAALRLVGPGCAEGTTC